MNASIEDWLALIDDHGFLAVARAWQRAHPTWALLWQVEDYWRDLQNWSA